MRGSNENEKMRVISTFLKENDSEFQDWTCKYLKVLLQDDSKGLNKEIMVYDRFDILPETK